MAACRGGDVLVVTKLDRLARSPPDARDIVAELIRPPGQALLLEGGDADPSTGVVLEFNRPRRSALHGLVPVNDVTSAEADEESARRIVIAHEVHMVGGDGERSPLKGGMTVADLDLDEMVSLRPRLRPAHARPSRRPGLAVGRGLRARDLAGIMHPYPTWGDGPWNAAVAEVREQLAGPVARRAIRALAATRRRWLDHGGVRGSG